MSERQRGHQPCAWDLKEQTISWSISPPWCIFGCHTGTPWVDRHQTARSSDLHHCAQFQPNPFSSYGWDASRTDRQTDSTLNIPLYNEEINCEGRLKDLMECKARYTLATKSKGRSTFGRQKSPTFDKVDWVERVQLELWRRCRPQQIGDKSAICRRFVDCRLCHQCVPGLRD